MSDANEAISPDRMRTVETSLLSTQMKNRGMSVKSQAKSKKGESLPRGHSTTLRTTIGEGGPKGSETNPGERRSKFYKDVVIIRRQDKMMSMIYTDNTF